MSLPDYGKIVRIVRAALGVEQQALAKLLKCDKSYLSLLESGKRKPSVDLLERLAKVAELPVSQLVELGEGYGIPSPTKAGGR